MKPDTVLIKTQKGQEEIDTRQYKLGYKLRSLLIMTGGSKTVRNLVDDFAQHGNTEELLLRLIEDGFIEPLDGSMAKPVDAVPQTQAFVDDLSSSLAPVKNHLATFIQSVLGADGAKLAKKVHSCNNSSDLKEAIETFRGIVESLAGKRKAQEFVTQIEALRRDGSIEKKE